MRCSDKMSANNPIPVFCLWRPYPTRAPGPLSLSGEAGAHGRGVRAASVAYDAVQRSAAASAEKGLAAFAPRFRTFHRCPKDLSPRMREVRCSADRIWSVLVHGRG